MSQTRDPYLRGSGGAWAADGQAAGGSPICGVGGRVEAQRAAASERVNCLRRVRAQSRTGDEEEERTRAETVGAARGLLGAGITKETPPRRA